MRHSIDLRQFLVVVHCYSLVQVPPDVAVVVAAALVLEAGSSGRRCYCLCFRRHGLERDRDRDSHDSVGAQTSY